jgi:hypothetical protein
MVTAQEEMEVLAGVSESDHVDDLAPCERCSTTTPPSSIPVQRLRRTQKKIIGEAHSDGYRQFTKATAEER